MLFNYYPVYLTEKPMVGDTIMVSPSIKSEYSKEVRYIHRHWRDSWLNVPFVSYGFKIKALHTK